MDYFNVDCKIGRLGQDYRGLLDYTKTGRWCILWTDQRLSDKGFQDADFPEGSVQAAVNYCRNPDGAGLDDGTSSGPYCYNEDLLKELCDVPLCRATGERKSGFDLAATNIF